MGRKSRIVSEDIKDRLDSKMGVSARDIIVNKNKGDVEISGCVKVLSEKNEAENIAADGEGITSIRNTITIAMDGSVSDKQIEADVNSKLRSSLLLDALKGVTARVSGGTAVLEGQVETEGDRKKALEEATKALGIKDVVNHIDISYRKEDVNIANEINTRYERSSIDVQDLSSIVDYGLVRLQGFVNNKGEVNDLVAIAEEIPGVKKVTSNLEIRDWNLN
jgi:hyperosmotically inducible periplasmic protein